jgi:hypothetical protein
MWDDPTVLLQVAPKEWGGNKKPLQVAPNVGWLYIEPLNYIYEFWTCISYESAVKSWLGRHLQIILVFHYSLISVVIELAEQAQKKEQQQQQLQKNKKKKATKSNTSTQVEKENGTTSVAGGIDSVSNVKKLAPKHQTATFTQSTLTRKGMYFELQSHSKQYMKGYP